MDAATAKVSGCLSPGTFLFGWNGSPSFDIPRSFPQTLKPR